MLARGIIPSVNQQEHQECGFLVPKDYYLAVDECHVSSNGYICERKGKIANNNNVVDKTE